MEDIGPVSLSPAFVQAKILVVFRAGDRFCPVAMHMTKLFFTLSEIIMLLAWVKVNFILGSPHG